MNTDVRHKRYFSIFFAACAIAAVAVTAPSASAATATVKGGALVFKAAPGERNFIGISQGKLTDSGSSVSVPLDGVDEMRIDVRDGNDRVYLEGTTIPVRIKGGFGDDYLVGGLGDDRIYGLQGDDTIAGDRGADVLLGGSGDDRVYAWDFTKDHVNCGSGEDIAMLDTEENTGGRMSERGARCEQDWTHIDDSTKTEVLRAVDAMDRCGQDNAGPNGPSYSRCDKATLLGIDSRLIDAGTRLTVTPETPSHGYTITVISNRAGTHTFTYVQTAGGPIYRTCTPQWDGGCPGGGVW